MLSRTIYRSSIAGAIFARKIGCDSRVRPRQFRTSLREWRSTLIDLAFSTAFAVSRLIAGQAREVKRREEEIIIIIIIISEVQWYDACVRLRALHLFISSPLLWIAVQSVDVRMLWDCCRINCRNHALWDDYREYRGQPRWKPRREPSLLSAYSSCCQFFIPVYF